MGNTCIPVADYVKFKNKIKFKIFKKKKHTQKNEDHGAITSWQIDRETMQTVRLYFLGPQNHCRW